MPCSNVKWRCIIAYSPAEREADIRQWLLPVSKVWTDS